VAVGKARLEATKKYYATYTGPMLVPINPEADFKIDLAPTGRQVPLQVKNKITGKPIVGAVLNVAGTQVKTDEHGEATVVLPPEKVKQEAVLKAEGFNDQKVTVTVSHLAIKDNTFLLTPAGKLYYLSKRTGKIDVMKADLDGTNASVVLAASGNESDSDTILLASRDWKYLALKSRREGSNAKVYLIDTNTDKLTEIDGGEAAVSLVGWSGHQLIFQLQRTNVQLWQNKRSVLKTYNAQTKQLAVIEESSGEGLSESDYANSEIQSVHILADRLVYNTVWYSGYASLARLNGKKQTIVSVKPDGSGKQTLKDFDAKTVSYINAVQSEVGEIYYRAFLASNSQFYTYQNGKMYSSLPFFDTNI
jgi:hypothetical protein